LMDVHMPGMGGIEAARQIHAANPDVMVVLMSTYDIEDISVAAADCGASAYLHKEQLSPDLLNRIWRTGG
jgi:two-component system, NarL family, invasion response regulator UvrY